MNLFEWDQLKDNQNQEKHGVPFELAKKAFQDPLRVIVEDKDHSLEEKRWFCLGNVDEEILTVRFTYRNEKIRIFGAGYWRKGEKRYEKENKIHKRKHQTGKEGQGLPSFTRRIDDERKIPTHHHKSSRRKLKTL